MSRELPKYLGAFALALTLSLTVGPAIAKRSSIPLTAEQEAAVDEVETYFNSFSGLRGSFTQLGDSGNVTSGIVDISKPGKMRFEYKEPNPFMVVSDGTWVAVINRARSTADQYPLATTPLRLLLAEEMNLRKNAFIIAADIQDSIVTLRLQDRDQFVAGELVLIYDSAAFSLRQWIVVDGQGKRTTISLEDIELNPSLDDKKFLIDIKRKKPSKDK